MALGAYYYVWYSSAGRHWGDSPVTPVPVRPRLGYYDSRDPLVLAQHISWFKRAGIDFAAVSWWGQGTPEDQATQAFAGTGFPFCILLEPPVQRPGDFDYVAGKYAVLPQYFRWKGKPLLYTFNVNSGPYHDPRFTVINIPQDRSFLDVYPSIPSQPETRNLGLYELRVLKGNLRQPMMITTFNDWNEATSIEPSATRWGTEYLDALQASRIGLDAGLVIGAGAILRKLLSSSGLYKEG